MLGTGTPPSLLSCHLYKTNSDASHCPASLTAGQLQTRTTKPQAKPYIPLVSRLSQLFAPGRENWLTPWPSWISHFMTSLGTGGWGEGGEGRISEGCSLYPQNISFSCRQLWTWLLPYMRSMRCGVHQLTTAVTRVTESHFL